MASQHSASLYVGDLHETITEALLYEVFREVGPIISIRVCRDAASRKSLGYAYVNFQNTIDAERALDALNYAIIKGKPIRIMWSQRDPSVRRSGIGNIFIKNLDKSIDNKALYDTFSAFGNILSCKVSTKQDKVVKGGDDDKVNYRGYGFVHFETQEAAEQAVAKVNGMLLNGKKVYVGPFIKRSERLKLINADEKYTNVFVKNVDKNVTKEELEKLFSECGEIQHAELAMDEQNKSKGFGFINYKKHEDAVKAADALNGKEMKGKKIYVARHQRREERVALIKDLIERKKLENNKKYQGANLYVKNLDDSFDDQKLQDIFAPFGAITCAKVMMRDDKPTVSRGFGFVNFEHPEDATKALAEMSGKIVGSKPLYVAIAQKKEVRKLQLEAQFRHRGVPFQQGNPMAMPLPFPPNAGAQPPMHFYPPHQGRPFGVPPQFPQKPRWFAPQRNNNAQQQPQVMQGAPNTVPPQVGGPAPTAASGAPQPMSYAQVIARGGPAPTSVQQGVGAMPPQGNVPQRGHHHQRRGGHQQFGVPQNQQRGNAARGYKYNQNARNRPDQQQPAPVQQGVAPQQAPVQQGAPAERADNALTLSNLSEFTSEDQKQIIGDRLFPLVHILQPAYSSKITGMFLEMETSDLLHLIESPDALNAKVQEAVAVLKEQQQ